MNVRVARRCAARMPCVPTRWEVSCVRASRSTQATRARRLAAATSTNARPSSGPAARTPSARTLLLATTVSAHKGIGPNLILKLPVNR